MARNQQKPKSKASLPHTRAIQRDRQKRSNSAPPDALVEQWFEEAVHPAALNQVNHFYSMGLRARVLTLPVMVAFVLGLIWRQLGSVREAVRVLRSEGLLWVTEPVEVSPQAALGRMATLPAELFARILEEVLPDLQQRATERQRPLPAAIAYVQPHYARLLSVDGSVLDGLLKKNGLLRDVDKPPLAGKIAALVDVATQVPDHIWYDEDSRAHDQRFWERIIAVLNAGTLLLFDKGLIEYARFDELTAMQVAFITRPKSNARYSVVRTLSKSAQIHDEVIRLGAGKAACTHDMRLVSVLFRGKWYYYLTNELDTQKLPAACVVALYDQRWRVEDAFNVVKRLLGLAYFHSGALNAVMLQVWATWLLYALLVDLTDAVADALAKPFKAISMEMVYRGLYHFAQARKRGRATDPIVFFVSKAHMLSLIKQKRRREHLSLIVHMELTIPPPA